MSISNSDDLIDVRNIIARVEELEDSNLDEDIDNLIESADATELVCLRELLQELCGNGGDEQWRGDWYPVTLIRESYFKDYAQELAEDLHGDKIRDAEWPLSCIDWDKAADELQQDYTAYEFDGVTYLAR